MGSGASYRQVISAHLSHSNHGDDLYAAAIHNTDILRMKLDLLAPGAQHYLGVDANVQPPPCTNAYGRVLVGEGT